MNTPEAVKHTPGPLQVISGPDGYSPAIALDDKRGAFIIAEMRDQMKGDDIVDATAERLVLAYNVHEEMLEALKAYQLVSSMESARTSQQKIKLLESVGDFDSGWETNWNDILDKYRMRANNLQDAAIAKAEGK